MLWAKRVLLQFVGSNVQKRLSQVPAMSWEVYGANIFRV
jgi:hypothetical protein